METIVIIGAGLIFIGILLSPIAVRTGAPLLLFFLGLGCGALSRFYSRLQTASTC